MQLLKWFSFGLLLFLCGCPPNIKYESDLQFLNAGVANAAEALVYLNNKICRDMDGNIGSCIMSIKQDQDIILKLDPTPTSYRLDLICSDNVPDLTKMYDIPENCLATKDNLTPCTIKLDHADFENVRVFNCIGNILPPDKPAFSFFTFRVIVVNSKYLPREQMQEFLDVDKKEYLILGKNSAHASIFVDGKWKHFTNTTIVDYKVNMKVINRSEMERLSYYGY